MHDLDRTLGRTQMEAESFGFETAPSHGETFGETPNELFGEFSQETMGEQQESLNESELNELTAELLSVSSEAELNQFLGDLIRRTASAAGKALSSPLGQQLGGMLKGVARKALPVVGSALGNAVLPGVGGVIGGKLASAAGSMFGLETEGLSNEDREYEVAKQFVRFATDATRRAVLSPSPDPSRAARAAVDQAAQRYVPGLASTGPDLAQSGRWVRRGRRIVLLGL